MVKSHIGGVGLDGVAGTTGSGSATMTAGCAIASSAFTVVSRLPLPHAAKSAVKMIVISVFMIYPFV